MRTIPRIESCLKDGILPFHKALTTDQKDRDESNSLPGKKVIRRHREPSAMDRLNPWRPLGTYDGRSAAGRTHSEDQAQSTSWKKLLARTHLFFSIAPLPSTALFSPQRPKCSSLFPGSPSFTTKPRAFLASPPFAWSWAEIAPLPAKKKFLLTSSQRSAPFRVSNQKASMALPIGLGRDCRLKQLSSTISFHASWDAQSLSRWGNRWWVPYRGDAHASQAQNPVNFPNPTVCRHLLLFAEPNAVYFRIIIRSILTSPIFLPQASFSVDPGSGDKPSPMEFSSPGIPNGDQVCVMEH